jgi:hypothetical protein
LVFPEQSPVERDSHGDQKIRITQNKCDKCDESC